MGSGALSSSIRPALVADIPSLAAIWIQSDDDFRAAIPAGYGKPMKGPGEEGWQIEWLGTALADTNRVTLVAVQDGTVLGCLMGEIKHVTDDYFFAPFLHVDHLWVERSARRSGIGRALMKSAEQLGKDRGMTAIDLDVSPLNPAGVALYESLGFTVLSRRMSKMIS